MFIKQELMNNLLYIHTLKHNIKDNKLQFQLLMLKIKKYYSVKSTWSDEVSKTI